MFVDERCGDITILDWKRSQRISWGETAFRTLREPINHLPDCNFWTYSLQLNIYKYSALVTLMRTLRMPRLSQDPIDTEPNCC